MIEISTGKDVERLIDLAIARPDRLVDIALCAPFIDDRLLPRLAQLAVAARRANCGFRIVTSRNSATALLAQLPGPPAFWRRTVVVNDRVHAKAYLVTPRGRGHAKAIVTSANLTWGGVAGNLELGVAATTGSAQGRRVVHAVREFIGRVAA
ncbi:hypothetical protein [Mesorhizobium sp. M0006]|uniref:hypothetical protein n=1 Tax=Mesorhizobium sp. M0006 TaxID=2956838 RepID=UPI0033383242